MSPPYVRCLACADAQWCDDPTYLGYSSGGRVATPDEWVERYVHEPRRRGPQGGVWNLGWHVQAHQCMWKPEQKGIYRYIHVDREIERYL